MKNIDLIIETYIVAAITYGEETEEGNYKVVNREYRKLTKIYRKMETDLDIAQQILEKLLIHPNDHVRLWAAAHALGLNLYVNQSIEILEDVSKRPKFLGFDAKMTLEVWREQGKLSF